MNRFVTLLRRLFLSGCAIGFLAAMPACFAAEAQYHFPQAEKYTLKNGLQVLLHQDKSAPVACVYIFYQVGSKDEKPGQTGFAHLFEHLMFEGSEHRNTDYFRPINELGGSGNGWTAQDRTGYYEVMPRNALEFALWMESDRMGYLLPVMTQQKLDNQRLVVKNEKRQRYDNAPYGQVRGAIAAALYPPDHPYSWIPIGSMEDLARRLQRLSECRPRG